RQSAAALDERGVRRFRLGGDARLIGGGLAALEEPALRRRELLVGRFLLGLDSLNRLPRFLLTLLLRPQLFLGAAPLDGDLLLLAGDTLRRLAGVGHLQVVADDRLFLAVQLRLQRGDGRLGRGDRHLERTDFLAQARQRRLLAVGALAQLLDL